MSEQGTNQAKLNLENLDPPLERVQQDYYVPKGYTGTSIFTRVFTYTHI